MTAMAGSTREATPTGKRCHATPGAGAGVRPPQAAVSTAAATVANVQGPRHLTVLRSSPPVHTPMSQTGQAVLPRAWRSLRFLEPWLSGYRLSLSLELMRRTGTVY